MWHALDSLCSHMVRHIFLTTTQEPPNAGQLKTQTAVSLVGLNWVVAIEGYSVKLPLRLSGIHAPNEGRKERWIVVVDQGHIAAKGILVRTLSSVPDLVLDFFMRFVLRD